GGDELAVEQGGDDAAGIYAADFADLGHRDRLLVGDDGKRLERRKRQPEGRFQALGESAHHVVLLGLGGHAVSAGDVADFDSVVCAGVIRDEFFERGANARLDFRSVDARSLRKQRLLHQRENLVKRDGNFRRVNDSFELGSETHKVSCQCLPVESRASPPGGRASRPSLHQPLFSHFQSSRTAACSVITSSKWECLRTSTSPKTLSCRTWIACRRTSSSSARNMQTSPARDATLPSICFSRIGRSSSASRRCRYWIIWPTVTVSSSTSRIGRLRARSRICWKVLTRSITSAASSGSVPSASMNSRIAGLLSTASSICCFCRSICAADLNFSCSSRRLTSSLRGSSCASAGASGSRGNNIFDLM